jgi:uncharacterized phiE125 gp8 family phage protein
MSRLATIRPRSIAELLTVSIEGSELEPVTKAEAKAYARIDGSSEDTIVDMLIAGSIEDFQAYTGKLLYEQEVVATFKPKEYENILYAPWLPILSIATIVEDGETLVEGEDYEVRGDYIEIDATKEVTVTYVAGLYEANPVSDDIKLGCLKWILSNYEDRQDTAGVTVQKMPNGSKSHWQKYKTMTI